MATVTVLYFAHLAERTGTREESVNIEEGETLDEFVKRREATHERLKGALKACRIAVDEEFEELSRELNDGETVAFIPPVSGGSN